MGREVLRKKLSDGEKAENWIYVPKRVLDQLGHSPKVWVKGREIPLSSSGSRVWPQILLWSQFVRMLRFDEENDELVFTANDDGTLALSCKKTNP